MPQKKKGKRKFVNIIVLAQIWRENFWASAYLVLPLLLLPMKIFGTRTLHGIAPILDIIKWDSDKDAGVKLSGFN